MVGAIKSVGILPILLSSVYWSRTISDPFTTNQTLSFKFHVIYMKTLSAIFRSLKQFFCLIDPLRDPPIDPCGIDGIGGCFVEGLPLAASAQTLCAQTLCALASFDCLRTLPSSLSDRNVSHVARVLASSVHMSKSEVLWSPDVEVASVAFWIDCALRVVETVGTYPRCIGIVETLSCSIQAVIWVWSRGPHTRVVKKVWRAPRVSESHGCKIQFLAR